MPIVFNPFTGGFVVVPNPTFPGTLVISSGKTLTVNNTLTFAGTDGTTTTFPTTSAAVARTDAGQTFTGAQVISGVAVGSVPLTLTAPIQTTDIAALSIAQTWNNAGINFTGAILLNVTNTNSAYESKLINLRVGGIKIFSVDRNGSIQLSSNGGGSGVQINANTNQSILGVVGLTLSLYDGSTIGLGLYPAVGVLQRAANYVGWTSSTDLNGGSVDLTLFRDAANALAQRNGTAAQRANLYNTFTTVATAGEWWKADWQGTANQFRMGAVAGSSSGTNRAASWDYGDKLASATAAITVPATSGNIVFGGGVQLSNAAVTGLVAGAVAALTTATIVLYDSTGQAYRVPCVI